MSLTNQLKKASLRTAKQGVAKKITFFTSESATEGHPDKVCDQIPMQFIG